MEYNFKDSNHHYWKITLKADGNRYNHLLNDEGDHVWEYTISKLNDDDQKYEIKWSGTITGQCDELPRLKEILHDWIFNVTSICFDGLK